MVFELCHEFGWSWNQLQEMPAYWRRVFIDMLHEKRSAENTRAQRRQPNA